MRKIFKDVSKKNLDWPEGIWDAWLSFENLHGSVGDLEACMSAIEKLSVTVANRRAKVCVLSFLPSLCSHILFRSQEAQKYASQTQPVAVEQQYVQPANIPPVAPAAGASSALDMMDIDVQPAEERNKRKAEDDNHGQGGAKRVKTGISGCILLLGSDALTCFIDETAQLKR